MKSEQLGIQIVSKLKQIREAKGGIQLEDIGGLVEEVIRGMQHDIASESLFHRELNEILQTIGKAREEISTIVTESSEGESQTNGSGVPISQEELTTASQQLDAVVKATEEATDKIMDAADEISQFVSACDDDVSAKVGEAVVKIYEACNFQDLTGQRIGKVLTTLETIEAQIQGLSVAMEKIEKTDPQDPANLLNGPQMPDKAPSQEDIDALFDSL